MRQLNTLSRFILIGIGLIFVFSSCASFKRSAEDLNPADKPQMRITMIEAYQGVKDGNVESVQLPADSAFVTIRICAENLSSVEESVNWDDVFLDLGDSGQIHPVAVGYDQAEAFSWLLPIEAPLGAKRITHKFYFFLIQGSELIRIPANQSLGCSASVQFKSLALLFIVKKELVGKAQILNFLSAPMPFTAKKVSPFEGYLKWGIGLGLFLILIVIAGVVVRTKKSKTQAPVVPEEKPE